MAEFREVHPHLSLEWFIYVPDEGDYQIDYTGTRPDEAQSAYFKWAIRNDLPEGAVIWVRPKTVTITKYHAVMLDETRCEFGADVEAESKDEARRKLEENYPESKIVQLESPQDTADREKRIYDHIAKGGDWDDDGKPFFHYPPDDGADEFEDEDEVHFDEHNWTDEDEAGLEEHEERRRNRLEP